MDLDDRVGLEPGEGSALMNELEPLGSLHSLLRWGLGCRPPVDLVDVVIQDEFTHDVVMTHGDGRFLVFDTT